MVCWNVPKLTWFLTCFSREEKFIAIPSENNVAYLV
jgi:hypothetical protein